MAEAGREGNRMIDKVMDFSIMKNDIQIQFQVIRSGSDYLVLVVGGDEPHFGAVTIGEKNLGGQTLAREHHREDVVTGNLYHQLYKHCPGGLCIVCGIHVDGISREQIELIVDACRSGGEKILAGWQN